MKKMESQDYFGRVKAGMLLRKFLLPLHVEHQVAAGDKFDDEEKAGIGL